MLTAISKKHRHGEIISLTCKNHPEKRWNTKNITCIGARTIRFEGPGSECDCPISDLEPINAEPYSLEQ